MLDSEIIEALECCSGGESDCENCPMYDSDNPYCDEELILDVLYLIHRQNSEIEKLTYTLKGVMLSVDKWLEGEELKQDEVNRASAMREKTLKIVEGVQAKTVKEFAERLKEKFIRGIRVYEGKSSVNAILHNIDNLVDELLGGR